MSGAPAAGPLAGFGPDPALAPYGLPPRNGGWDSVLEPGERLLWQGRPVAGFRMGARQGVLAVIGAVVFALSLGLGVQGVAGRAAGDPQAGSVLALALVGVLFGVGCMIGPGLAEMLRRRGTAYALTDQRALIETKFMGSGLAAWPIGARSPVWRGRGARLACVWFAIHRPPARAMLLRPTGRMTGERPVGFEFVDQPDHVLGLLEKVRDGMG